MESLFKSDIFFFITSVSVVALSILIAIAVVYVIRILNDLKHISKVFKQEGDEIAGDMKSFRANIKENGLKLSYLFAFIQKAFKIKKKGSKKVTKN